MMSLEFIKIVRFKDNEGKWHSYAARFVFVNGGFKMSDEDLKAIKEVIDVIK